VPRDEPGKGFLRAALNVLAQQGVVIPVLHLHVNAAKWRKGTVFLLNRILKLSQGPPGCLPGHTEDTSPNGRRPCEVTSGSRAALHLANKKKKQDEHHTYEVADAHLFSA
jgi:hypothetical protein